MTQTLPELLGEIADDVQALTSVARLHEGPPESINEFPAVVVASTGFRNRLASHDGTIFTEHDIRLEVHVERKHMPDDYNIMAAIQDDVVKCIYGGFIRDRYKATMVTTGDPHTMGNASYSMEGDLGLSMYGGQQTYALMVTFKVTTEQEATA